jgi:predicted O-methyltransferase YrrM
MFPLRESQFVDGHGPKIPKIPALKESESKWTRPDLQVNPYLAKAFRTEQTVDNIGRIHKFKDVTSPMEGKHLYNLITQNKLTRTLEIGFAMGASAVYMCQAHKDLDIGGKHIAIDPNQSSTYTNIGRTMIKNAGLSDYIEVHELTSAEALPKINDRLHLVYIDGWHTFDQTLMDFFYADKLIGIGGIIVLDDIRHAPVNKFLVYVSTNYPNYSIERTPCYDSTMNSTQATFVKFSDNEGSKFVDF